MSQRINEDPLGLGVMRRDKVTGLAYTNEDASEEALRCTPLQACITGRA